VINCIKFDRAPNFRLSVISETKCGIKEKEQRNNKCQTAGK